LTREWIILSPHRTQRPWQGKVDTIQVWASLPDDPECYLCPGQARAGGAHTPTDSNTFLVQNDYAALVPNQAADDTEHEDVLIACSERGSCLGGRFAPRQDLTIPRMSVPDLGSAVDMWIEQFNDLGSREWVQHVQIFENRGAMMGASNPHPHCQIWAT